MGWKKIKEDILGKNYSLSVSYVSSAKSRQVNKKYRKKDKPTNVLSFPFSKNEGEILLCQAVIKKEAKKLDKPYGNYLLFLVIHGMLHLRGMEHSSTMKRAKMESAESFYLAKYDKKYFYRDRLGVRHNSSRGGRIHQGRKKS